MTTAAFRFHRRRRIIWQTDRTALISIAWALLAFSLLVYWPNDSGYGLEPYVRLPYSDGSAACLQEKPFIIISVDAQNRIYLAHEDRAIQTEMLRQMAASYSVALTPRQITALKQLPYFGLELQQLPAYLELSAYQRRQLLLPGVPNDPLQPQFADCVLRAHSLTIQRLHTAPYIALRLDARLSAARVKRVMRALEQRGLHRFYLVRVS